MAIFFEQPHIGKYNLREFLSHLYLDCMIRFKNESEFEYQTTPMAGVFTSASTFMNAIMLYEDAVDMQKVDNAAAEREGRFDTLSTYISSPPINSEIATSSPNSLPQLIFCPLRFDGYLCWPRTPAGTVLSQYCPDFVEGFNRKFLAHKM
ncbi:uncharacterized protein LOC119665883 [Teleopsis dalmanni]|uniref:uncharacterized protein LOC119665883 n=1 Tax=Teleopsis dalmanni TaxID=139649 RepID=UPI0018CF7A3A|nr:uncharacterized protein LOC119665883 [Teleopsis dalmanni]